MLSFACAGAAYGFLLRPVVAAHADLTLALPARP